MRKSLRSAAVASVLIALLAFPRPADAWGNTGHEAVACVAWKLLNKPVKDKVFALLQQVPERKTPTGKTIAGFKTWSTGIPAGLTEDEQHMYIFMRAATWADSIKHVGLNDTDTPPADPKKAQSNIGFTDGFSHGYWHFVDNSFGTAATAHSKPPAVPRSCWIRKKGQDPVPPTPVKAIPPTPQTTAATEITLLTAALTSGDGNNQPLKAYDMIWLEHIVGDIHQPLHATTRYVRGIADVGGNCIAISLPEDLRPNFASSNPKAKPPSELHAFWDDLPGVGTQAETKKAADYAATLSNASPSLVAINDPNIWAKESFDLAQKDAYVDPIGPALGSPKAYIVSDDYYKAADKDARMRIALAGARLANLLNNALQ